MTVLLQVMTLFLLMLCGFAAAKTALLDDKLCIGGEGEVTFEVELPETFGALNDLTLYMEAGSKRVLKKDLKEIGDPQEDHGFMLGEKEWMGKNVQPMYEEIIHTPFFLYYEDDFRPFYEQKIEFLYDFNMRLTQLVCQLIGIDTPLLPTTEYGGAGTMTDLRECIHPKQAWATDKEFAPKDYYQVFKDKHGFMANMSIVDLLFNMGPESILILNESCSR